jgi:hypothetical protein
MSMHVFDTPPLGFYFFTEGTELCPKTDDPKIWLKRDITMILAYIPIIGTIIGLARVFRSYKEADVEYKLGHLIRGLVELTSVGIVLLPIDVAETVIRGVGHCLKSFRSGSGNE